MATNVIELLGLTPSDFGRANVTRIAHYDLETSNFKIYIAVDINDDWHCIDVYNNTGARIIRIICYNSYLFIEQVKLIEKELDIKLIKE